MHAEGSSAARGGEIVGADGPLDAPRELERDWRAGSSVAPRGEDVVIDVDEVDACMMQDKKSPDEYSVGWLLFACGFVCILPWALGGVLPCISDNPQDTRAAYFNIAAFIAVCIAFAMVVVAYA
eukprot:evm.model.scf_451.5 EVM.evm.TU.scf_451.5   scf_451:55005-56796(-)